MPVSAPPVESAAPSATLGPPPVVAGAPGADRAASAVAVLEAPTGGSMPAQDPSAAAASPGAPATPRVPYVSPLRAEARPAAIVPPDPITTYGEPVDGGAEDTDDEPALPDEARDRALEASRAPTAPLAASPGTILHVRFSAAADTDRVVGAMEEVRTVLRSRPGTTRVVLHLPQGGGRDALPMELRSGVAYDAELLAEVGRRFGDGIVDLRLS